MHSQNEVELLCYTEVHEERQFYFSIQKRVYSIAFFEDFKAIDS